MNPKSCIKCDKIVTTRQHAIQCENWQHRLCDTGVNFEDYKKACKGMDLCWVCAGCKDNVTTRKRSNTVPMIAPDK